MWGEDHNNSRLYLLPYTVGSVPTVGHGFFFFPGEAWGKKLVNTLRDIGSPSCNVNTVRTLPISHQADKIKNIRRVTFSVTSLYLNYYYFEIAINIPIGTDMRRLFEKYARRRLKSDYLRFCRSLAALR